METSFDDKFSTVPDLNWLPWVAPHFKEKRVLILGESHYDDGDDWLIYKNATREFVKNQGLNSQNPAFKRRGFFQKIEQTLLNKKDSSYEEREKLWNNVAFYNLIQRLLPTSKDRPTQEDYDTAWKVFLHVADILKPRVCIKYGVEQNGRLGYLLNNSDTGWDRDNVKEFFDKPFCFNLTKGNHKMRIILVYHPSAYCFDYTEWDKHIRNQFPDVDSLFK
jgi:hypothetical protein